MKTEAGASIIQKLGCVARSQPVAIKQEVFVGDTDPRDPEVTDDPYATEDPYATGGGDDDDADDDIDDAALMAAFSGGQHTPASPSTGESAGQQTASPSTGELAGKQSKEPIQQTSAKPPDVGRQELKAGSAEYKRAHSAAKYKLANLAPEHIKAKWAELDKGGKEKTKDRKIMFREVMYMDGVNFDTEFFNSFKTVSSIDEDGEDWGWISFKKLCDNEGLDVAMEMIETKIIKTRAHKNLSQDSKLEWPKTLQFKYIEEGGSSKTRTEQGISLKRKAPGTKETVGQFDSIFSSMQSAEGEPQPKGQTNEDAKEKVIKPEKSNALKRIDECRAAHRAWDNAKTEFEAWVQKAQLSSYLADGKLVGDLKKALVDGAKFDVLIQRADVAYRRSDDVVEFSSGNVWAEGIAAAMKSGKSTGGLMRPLMKLNAPQSRNA